MHSDMVLESVLSATIAILVYTWVVYPVLLWLGASLRSSEEKNSRETATPMVSIIIAVHNEERTIAAKLRDCTKLQYPADKLEILIASDGSNDSTESIVRSAARQDPRIRLIASDGRLGKSGVQNLAVVHAQGDLLLFTDAEASFAPKALRSMVDKLGDPKVGLVTATVLWGHPEDAIEKGQGFYWRYELFLRNAESRLGILATGSGQALLVRRELFRPVPSRYGDDCVMPIAVRLQGYRVVQDGDAIVFDTMPHSIEGELRTRVRMTARNWTGTLARPAIFNLFRFPLTAAGLISHKLLRWLTPVFLALLLLLTIPLAVQGKWMSFLVLQLVFYFSALLGWRLSARQRSVGILGYAFSFCLANVGFALGIIKAFRQQAIITYR